MNTEQQDYTKHLEQQIEKQRTEMLHAKKMQEKAEEKCEKQKEMYEKLLNDVNETLQKSVELTHFFYEMFVESLKGDDES